MKLKKDDVVYYIDFWGKRVLKGKMMKALDADSCVKEWEAYVLLDRDNHPSYLKQDFLYFNEKNAKKRLELETQIYNLRNEDIAEKCTDEFLNESEPY